MMHEPIITAQHPMLRGQDAGPALPAVLIAEKIDPKYIMVLFSVGEKKLKMILIFFKIFLKKIRSKIKIIRMI